MPAALTEHMDGYLQHLFAVATDPSEEVRKRVCQALVMLLDVQLEKLMPHMNNVVQVPPVGDGWGWVWGGVGVTSFEAPRTPCRS